VALLYNVPLENKLSNSYGLVGQRQIQDEHKRSTWMWIRRRSSHNIARL